MYYFYAPNATTDAVTVVDIDYNIYDPTGIFAFARSEVATLTPAIQDYATFSDWKNCDRHTNKPDAHGSTSTSIATYWRNVTNHDYHLTSMSSPLYRTGLLTGLPPDALLDRDGKPRSGNPCVGPYEVGNLLTPGGSLTLTPCTGAGCATITFGP